MTAANSHLAMARQQSQREARRHRQIIEIAELVVSGADERAAGLALMHGAEFPEDEDLLDRITTQRASTDELDPPRRSDREGGRGKERGCLNW
jgi:hypothetical protein